MIDAAPCLVTGHAGRAGPDQAARLRALVDDLLRRGEAAPTPAAETGPGIGKIVAITSGKGGVGKTFTAVNLAIAMARLGCRVSVVDADPGLANADVICGLAPARRLGEQPARALSELEIPAPGGFGLVPGSVGAAGLSLDAGPARAGFIEGIRGLARRRDLVIIDTGAGLSPAITACAAAADAAVIVVTPEPTSMADAYAMIKCLRGRAAAARIKLIINQSCGRVEASSVYSRLAAVSERFLQCSPALLGVIAQDERVRLSIRERRPLLADPAARGPARRDLLAVALRLASELGLAGTARGAAAGGVDNSKVLQSEGLIARFRRRLSVTSRSGMPGGAETG